MRRDYEKNENHEKYENTKTFRLFRYFRLFRNLSLIFALTVITFIPQRTVRVVSAKSAAEERRAQIDSALFTRAEFFGVQAIMPYPTAEARERMRELQNRYPQDSEITLKLAEFDEKLGKADQARLEMLRYVDLEKNSPAALEKLVEFYNRQALFADEAVALEQMITLAPRGQRAQILYRLIDIADRHRLEKYRKPEFFHGLIASDPGAFEVVKQSLDHLLERKDYSEALSAVRRYKGSFPEQQIYFIRKEVDALLGLKKEKEAEAFYIKSFDPFWSDEQSYHFYWEFLSQRDKLRAYGRELKKASIRDPADFDDLWGSIAERVRTTGGQDREMIAALEAFSLFHQKREQEAIKISSDAANLLPASHLKFFTALLEKNGGHERESLQRLLDSMIDLNDIAVPFNTTEDELRWQIIRLYAGQGRVRAALKLASVDGRLKGESQKTTAPAPVEDNHQKTLAARAAARERRSRSELLGLLSFAAEKINEFSNAADFERARLKIFAQRFSTSNFRTNYGSKDVNLCEPTNR
jgi:hypothetical protein